MKTAFPKAEQMPLWLLRFMAFFPFVHFWAMYDGDTFCGTLYTIEDKKYVFILYLAVNEDVRSNGYGSRILEYVKETAKGKEIVLNIEYPDENAENIEQRMRRAAFYATNGIVDTGHSFWEAGVKYAILSTAGKKLTMREYWRVMGRMVFTILVLPILVYIVLSGLFDVYNLWTR